MPMQISLSQEQRSALTARDEGTPQEICQRICEGVADHYIEEAPKIRAHRIRRKFRNATEEERTAAETALENAPENVEE